MPDSLERSEEMAEKRGRPQKFKSKKALKTAIDAYFNAISSKKAVPNATNADGKQYYDIVYREPPTVGGLCMYLGISRKTWENYCNKEEYPDFEEVTSLAKTRMEAYCEGLLLKREKGSVQGVIFNLQNNYGWCDKKEIEHKGEINNPFSDLSEEELKKLAGVDA